MDSKRNIVFRCVCSLILLTSGTVPVASTLSCDTSLESRENTTNQAIHLLRAQGYEISRGEFKVVNSTSFGANPGNPYEAYWSYKFLPLWRFGPKDAVLFVGCTPPEVRYFSWRSYVMTKGLHLVFASLGDSLNNLVINTTSADPKDVFQKTTAVLTTADATTYSDIRGALRRAKFDTSAINLDDVPANRLNFALDTFIMLHRTSIWASNEDREAYYAQPARSVYFIKAPNNQTADALPPVPIRARGTGKSEEMIEGLPAALKQLNQAVRRKVSVNRTFISSANTTNYPLDGFFCLEENTNCLGDNHDTNYIRSPNYPMAEEDLYAVTGVNHVATSKCTYVNLGIYKLNTGRKSLTSSKLSVDDRKFVGSARLFTPESKLADKLFVVFLARNCSLNPVIAHAPCLSVGIDIIPANAEWEFVYRTYLEPSTRTGPLVDELILPQVMHFRDFEREGANIAQASVLSHSPMLQSTTV